MKQVVQGSNIVLLEVGTKLHITANLEVASVLLLNRTHVGIIALITELTILVSRSVPTHPWRIFCHMNGVYNSLSAPSTCLYYGKVLRVLGS